MCNHSYGCNPTTKRMQIFFDTGAKFHEFPLWCGIAERIGWKPSSYAPYKNPAFETLSLSILKHLCFWECKARISRCIVIFACTIYVLWFVGGWRGIFLFFFSSSSDFRLFFSLLQTLKSSPWKLLPWILIFLVNRIIFNFARII